MAAGEGKGEEISRMQLEGEVGRVGDGRGFCHGLVKGVGSLRIEGDDSRRSLNGSSDIEGDDIPPWKDTRGVEGKERGGEEDKEKFREEAVR
ncbi:hypothetical protein IEQ34_020389 [Dendrobium chrysotoxum]|uniref:Uncharacterized protein n=1 Tax=Dendrobium chrysotoxum TaxID=161865 RepID=A0AAV7G0K6_DENCH|nr:hypothetical protein IEQ34_020389 [Dendrobium chrysotoxum]